MMRYILERFEGDTAVIEASEEGNISFLDVSKAELPADVQEGDVLIRGADCWQRDQQAAQVRREAAAQRLKRMGLL